MWFLLVVVVLAAVFLFARTLLRKTPQRPQARPRPQVHLPAPGDDEEERRPETDPAALARARAAVSQDVPDEVLADALQDASPAELAKLFAAVPTGVMAAAMGGQGTQGQPPARASDLAQLRGAGDAVDDLEIFSFGKDD